MKKGMLILKEEGFEGVKDLPRTAECFESKAHQDLPPQLRSPATSNGEHRVRVLVPNAQGLHYSNQFLMQEYLKMVDWKGLNFHQQREDAKRLSRNSQESLNQKRSDEKKTARSQYAHDGYTLRRKGKRRATDGRGAGCRGSG